MKSTVFECQQGRYAASARTVYTALSKFPTFTDLPDVEELSAVHALYVAVHVPVFTCPSCASRDFSLPVAHAHLRILAQARLFPPWTATHHSSNVRNPNVACPLSSASPRIMSDDMLTAKGIPCGGEYSSQVLHCIH
jgi:hypothetical protein